MLLKIYALAVMMGSQIQLAFETPSLILYSFTHSLTHSFIQ